MERKRSLYLKIVIVVAVIIALNSVFLSNPLQGFFYRIAARPVSFFESKLQSKRIAKLEQERNELIGKIVTTEALERENEALRRQLRVEGRTQPARIAAKIFSLQRTPLVSTLMIDRGKADGLASGMVVVAPGNILVGTIGEAFEHSSRVILADDPRLIISARVLGTSILAESKGALRNEAAINLIAHTETLEVGATIVTSGLDVFPEGLAIGTVAHVDRGENTLFKDVRASLLFDPAQSSILFIFSP